MNTLTTADVAAMLRKSTRTVSQLARHGAIRASKVGRDWRFDPADVQRFLDEHENVSRPSRRRRRAA